MESLRFKLDFFIKTSQVQFSFTSTTQLTPSLVFHYIHQQHQHVLKEVEITTCLAVFGAVSMWRESVGYIRASMWDSADLLNEIDTNAIFGVC